MGEAGDIDHHEVQLHPPGFDFGQVEDLVDEPE